MFQRWRYQSKFRFIIEIGLNMNLFEEGKKMKLVGTKEKDQTWAELQI